jgi:hypothetical protein
MVRFPKKISKFGHLKNRSSNLEQRLLLKVSSNLEQRESVPNCLSVSTKVFVAI